MADVLRFPQMPEHRRRPDRRRVARGGRRSDDRDGVAPLVLLVGGGDGIVAQSEAVLARLRFAVTTTGSVEDALNVLTGIRPDIVVAEAEDASRIRKETPAHLPVVVVTNEMRSDPEVFVERIRQTLAKM
jgi:hypothetical protein